MKAAVAIAMLVGALDAHAQQAPDDGGCFPACRSGFVCHASQCISACNPACAANETCDASGQCVSQPPPAPTLPPPLSTQPLPVVQPPAGGLAQSVPADGEAASPGWAGGASVFGWISAGAIMALAIGVVAENSPHSADEARGIGTLAILYAAVSVPVTAIGGHSARHHPAVRGVPALRIASWIGYGLTLVDALALLGASYDAQISNAQIISVGALGSLSAIGFALDAGVSASQARAAALGVHPVLGVLRTRDRESVPMLALEGRF